MRNELPEFYFFVLPDTGQLVTIKRNEQCYYHSDWSTDDKVRNREIADFQNRKLGITPAQQQAMQCGSMFGWKSPGANPQFYLDKAEYAGSNYVKGHIKHPTMSILYPVDSGKLKLVPAADYISHLSEKEQTYLALVMERDEVSPSVGQAKRMKELSTEGKLEENIIDLLMREEKPLEHKITLDGKWVQKRFPKNMTPQQIMDRINKALDLLERTERRKQEQSR